jgi:S1-C subfamily serine protease
MDTVGMKPDDGEEHEAPHEMTSPEEEPPEPGAPIPSEPVSPPTEPAPAPPDTAASGPIPGWSWDPGAWIPVPRVEEPPRRRGRTALAAVLAALLLLSAGIGIGWGLTRANDNSPAVALAPIDGQNPSSLRAIADRVGRSVVDINVVIGGSLGGLPFGGGGGQPTGQAAGTGIILSPAGEVLTNNHVIEGASTITVTIPGRSGSFTAQVAGADPTDDIALLRLQGVSGLPAVAVGDPSELGVGDEVIALGNALGRGGDPSVTAGNVSGLDRSITAGGNGSAEHLTGLIQTDASISPGESGGPLVNDEGQVVGVITAAARSGPFRPSSNVGFAIPIDDALGIVRQIRTGQASSSVIIGQAGFIGVQVQNLDSATAAQLGLSAGDGALVVDVVPGAPAAQAGITPNAVITAVDGRAISSADALSPAIHTHKPGDRIQVTWVDGNGTHNATVSLVAGPAV